MKGSQMRRPMMQEYLQADTSSSSNAQQYNQNNQNSQYNQNNQDKQFSQNKPRHYQENNMSSQGNQSNQSNQGYGQMNSNSNSGRMPPNYQGQSHDGRNDYSQNNQQNNYQGQSQQNNYQGSQSNQSTNQATSQPTTQVPQYTTSQAHKIKEKDYKINPRVIPRPNKFDEIFRNNEKLPIFETNEDLMPPHSSTFYTVKETQNSSCRLVRSSLTKIPVDQSTINGSSLLFGLYCQPFAEFQQDEAEIPKVEVNDSIFRCRRCNTYINSKFEITYSKSNKQVAICNICNCENDLDTSKSSVKSEYFTSNVSSVPELSSPTVDFLAPTNMRHTTPFYPHYIFMIDISQLSNDIGLTSYVMYSIQSNLDYIHTAASSHIAIATYDNRSIQFFSIDGEDVKAYIMSDIENPFCPLPKEKLFMNVVEQRDSIEKVIEKINFYITSNTANSASKSIPGSVSGAAIAAGVSALEENGGRVMLFTANACITGFGACRPREEAKLFKSPQDERQLYMPQHNNFNILAKTCIEKRVVVDQFVFASTQYDLSTFSTISNLTGGCVKYYPAGSRDKTDYTDMKHKFEKLHYDISRALSRPNYYDVKFMLRFSIGIDSYEILGPFNKNLGEGFQLASCDPDYSFAYNLRLSESLKPNARYHFQLVTLYISNDNQRYLRCINYTVISTNETAKIYSSADVDALSKISIMKEVSLSYQSDTNTVRDNLATKMTNAFYYYRTQCSKSTPVGQLILPASIKYYPLYLNSFIKKPLLRRVKLNSTTANQVIALMNRLMRDPIYSCIKYLNPKFYRVDDIMNDQSWKVRDVDADLVAKDIGLQSENEFNNGNFNKPYILPLSLDHVDFNCAYMCDNGEYISMFVFDEIEGDFYEQMFGVSDFGEASELNVEGLDEGNSNELNVRMVNLVSQFRKDNKGVTQPFRIYFLNNTMYNHTELGNVLIEDRMKDEAHYVDFLCNMHEEIQRKMNS